MGKKCVAMLLAGGQGSRLGVLTKNMAKPAVPFGGKYRIIDFPLSNCSNSGIDVVGVLTQYQPLELNSYIGNGMPWDLDRLTGGAYVLPPYQKGKSGTWYKGTANAIYQNLAFIEQYDPQYVLVLSGDHIYKMDYSDMIAVHEKKHADCTIAVYSVPWNEASRFGIMNTNDEGDIVEFEEKPAEPKSNNASMGIYVFNWKDLKQYLIEDEANPESSNDFGKNIIPRMLGEGKHMVAYNFEGYWKDVGTISSLWEANMDLLGKHPAFDIYGTVGHKIYARNQAMPSSFISRSAEIRESFVAEGCNIEGSINHSIISTGCSVGKGAEITDSVIMPDVVIENGAVIRSAIIAEGCHIKAGARVGDYVEGEERKISVIGKDKIIAEGTVIDAGAIV